MKNKLKTLRVLLVLAYALSTVAGAILVVSDETFHFGEWLFSGSPYPVFVLLYHVSMISGCILVLSGNVKPSTSKYVLMAMALLLAASRFADYIISLIPLINKFRLGSPEVARVLTDALIRPGGIAAEIFLAVIALILFYGSGGKGAPGGADDEIRGK